MLRGCGACACPATHLAAQLEVLVEKRLDGTYVLPVPVEGVGYDVHVLGGRGDDLAAKVVGRGEDVVEQFDEHVLLEDVDPHRGDEGLRSGLLGGQACRRRGRGAL